MIGEGGGPWSHGEKGCKQGQGLLRVKNRQEGGAVNQTAISRLDSYGCFACLIVLPGKVQGGPYIEKGTCTPLRCVFSPSVSFGTPHHGPFPFSAHVPSCPPSAAAKLPHSLWPRQPDSPVGAVPPPLLRLVEVGGDPLGQPQPLAAAQHACWQRWGVILYLYRLAPSWLAQV